MRPPLQDLLAAHQQRLEGTVAAAAAPLRELLLDTVMPLVAAGLGELARSRPDAALPVIADKLRQARPAAGGPRGAGKHSSRVCLWGRGEGRKRGVSKGRGGGGVHVMCCVPASRRA
jgi:hypothetical protein